MEDEEGGRVEMLWRTQPTYLIYPGDPLSQELSYAVPGH